MARSGNIRLRHVRHSRFARQSRSRSLQTYLDRRVTILTGTGILSTFTAVAAAVAATGTLTFTNQPANTETVTVGGKTYTFQTTLTNVDGNILIGASTAASVTNLINAINLGAGSGTTYAALTTANTGVSAAQGAGTTITITALSAGRAGNSIASTETIANASFGGATLSGGEEGSVFTKSNHGFKTGDGPFCVSNSGGALPTGMVAVTRFYYIIKLDADKFQLSTSAKGAIAGRKITITGNGTGTNSYRRPAETKGQIYEWLRRRKSATITAVEDIDSL